MVNLQNGNGCKIIGQPMIELRRKTKDIVVKIIWAGNDFDK